MAGNNTSANLSIGVSMDTRQVQRESATLLRTLRGVKKDLNDYSKEIADLKQKFKDDKIGIEEYQVAITRLELARAKSVKKINDEIEALKRLKTANRDAALESERLAEAERQKQAAADNQEFGDNAKRLRAEAEAQQQLARAVRESLAAQRQAAFESARRTSQRLDPAEFYKAGMADILAQKATGGLTPEAEAKRIQELTDATNELDDSVQQEIRSQKDWENQLKRTRIEQEKQAEAQRKQAQAVRESLAAQRQAAFESARAMELGVNPAARRQALVADVSAAQASGGLSRRGAQTILDQEGVQYMRQFYTERQRVNAALREANALYRAGSISQNQYAQATYSIRSEATLASKSLTQMKIALSGILAPIAIAYSGYQALQKVIRDTVEFENAQASFRVFAGSAQGATKILSELRQLSAESPVSFGSSQRTTRTLLQYGVAAKDATAITKQLAEVAGGNAERMENLGLAMAQVVAAGRLMGQENIQLVNAGFSPLLLLSEKTGKSFTQLKREMEAGAISSEMVLQVLQESTSQGGKFFGLLDEMSQTTGGKINRLTSEIDQLSIAIGELAKPSLNDTVTQLTRLVSLARTSQIGDINLASVANAATGNVGLALSIFDSFDLMSRMLDIRKEIVLESDKDLQKTKEKTALEKEQMAIRDRVDKTYSSLFLKQQDALIAAQYEKDVAERIMAIRDQSVDFERELVDLMIKNGESYDDILSMVNPIVTAESEKLRILQEEAAAILKQKELQEEIQQNLEAAKREFDRMTENIQQQNQQDRDAAKKEIEDLKSRLQFEEDLVVVGEELARIEQLRRDKNLTEDEAKKVAALEKELKIKERMKEMDRSAANIVEANNPKADFVKTMAELEALRASGKLGEADYLLARNRALQQASSGAGSVNAAPVIEKGSQEAYQALTGQTVDKINTQIKIQEQQRVLDENRNKILTRANELLESIDKQKIKKVGP